MMLAEDARDANGRLLLPRGAPVSEDQIEALHRRGAAAVLLMNREPADDEARALSLDAVQVEQRLDRLFRRCGDEAPVRALRESLLRYRMNSSR